MTRVKICGITRESDAKAAIEAGVSALGFVFFEKSPRFISISAAANLCSTLPPFISRVGVFVNEVEYTIEKALSECGLDTLQFHGDEPPGFCQKFSTKAIKAFHPYRSDDLRILTEYDVDAWLLDSATNGSRGGTGQTFDWNLAIEASKHARPLILSGGLTPENVTDAILKVKPYAVDVSSGVESSPGRKDSAKIFAFLEAVRAADRLNSK